MESESIKKDAASANAFDIDDSVINDRWCRCCPAFCNLPVATMVAIVLGLVSGGLMYEFDLPDYWEDGCYTKTSGSSSTSIIFGDASVEGFEAGDYKAMKVFNGGEQIGEVYLNLKTTKSPPATQSCYIEMVELPGLLWIRALKCIVAPLIASMMLLIPSKIQSLGAVGQRVAMLLLFTSFIAAMEGLIWGNWIKPGKHMEEKNREDSMAPKNTYVSEMEAFMNISIKFVPVNIFSDLASLQVLGIITFFLSFGIFLEKDVPAEWKKPILNAAKGFLRATLNCLMVIMWCMPIAMWSILAYNMMKTDLGAIMGATAMYLLTQLIGQFVHLGFYFLFFFVMTRRNPALFFWNIIKAPFTALLTSSSAATLPITLRENIKERGNDEFAKKVCEFVLPLGSTLNMDGTSLGFPIMVLFVHQVGEEMDVYDGGMKFGTQLLVALLSMTCSLGTAPIPNAGMVYLTMLLEAADIDDPTLQGLGFAMIYLVDWVVDRVETAQNVTSDSFISAIIAYSPCFKVMAGSAGKAGTELAQTNQSV